MYKTIDTLLDQFEYHKPDENGTNDKQREGYWSFKLDSISNENKYYRSLSDVMQECDLDENSRYNFTVEALEAMKQIILDNDIPREDELDALEDYGNLTTHSEAPTYYSELNEWISNNMYSLESYINECGWNNEIYSAIDGAYSQAWERHYMDILKVVQTLS